MINKKSTNIYAFTLIELLCVVSLLALICAIAAPAFRDLSHRRNLNIAARTMATEMRKVQQRAIMAGCGQIIEFVSSNRYRVIDGKTEERYNVFLPEGITIRNVNFPRFENVHYLRFNYNGSPSSGGTVTFENSGGDLLYVIVAPVTGRVRISEDPPEHWEFEP